MREAKHSFLPLSHTINVNRSIFLVSFVLIRPKWPMEKSGELKSKRDAATIAIFAKKHNKSVI